MTTTPFAAVVREVVTTALLWIGAVAGVAIVCNLIGRWIARAVDDALTGREQP